MVKAYQLKITLLNVRKRVWRKILISSNASFFDLHVAIQDSMGWTDSHLHEFYTVGKNRFDSGVRVVIPGAFDEFEAGSLDEYITKINRVLLKPKDKVNYIYDMGDNWLHSVILERIIEIEDDVSLPSCIGGKLACPPEDCGSGPGYENLIEIMSNPSHPEHQDMLEWLNLENADEFDPNHFDPTEVEFRDPKEAKEEFRKMF